MNNEIDEDEDDINLKSQYSCFSTSDFPEKDENMLRDVKRINKELAICNELNNSTRCILRREFTEIFFNWYLAEKNTHW